MAPWSSHTPTNSFIVYPSMNSSSPTFPHINNHNTEETLLPTTSKIPMRTSYKHWQISTASPERLSSTIPSSTNPTTRNNLSHCTSGSDPINIGYTVISNNPKSSFKDRYGFFIFLYIEHNYKLLLKYFVAFQIPSLVDCALWNIASIIYSIYLEIVVVA